MTCRLLLVVVALTSMAVSAVADRGHFLVARHDRPRAYLFDEGQQAIIVWDGKEETLILSTNLRASEDAVDVEFMPLPSKPKEVKKVLPGVFKIIERIIRAHEPPWRVAGKHRSAPGGPGVKMAAPKPAVVVVMHKKIGAHDITVARVDDFSGFRDWVQRFLEGRGLAESQWQSRVENLRKLVGEYLGDGYKFFVFDVIELGQTVRTVEPILYRFASSRLYYPLRVSQYSEGRTKINLFLITPGPVNVWGTRTGFWAGRFPGGRPIKFALSRRELRLLDFMPRQPGWRWGYLTNAVYKGPCFMLRADFLVAPSEMRLAKAY